MGDIKKEMAAAALAAFALTIPSESSAKNTIPAVKQTTQTKDDGLERTHDIKELNKTAGRVITRHIYDWQEVITKYKLNPADFDSNTKLSKEQELKCAATLKAISIYEASRPNAIEAAYFYEDLSKNWPDGEKENKIETALKNASPKSFAEILSEEMTHLENDKKAKKEALAEFDKFRTDTNKGYSLTQKVDEIIINPQKETSANKTMSATMFMNLAAQRSQ